MNRIAPYLVDVSSGARELVARRPADPLPLLGVLFTPIFTRMRELLGGILGGAATIQLRLRQAGSPLTVEAFRSHQLVWGLGGIAVGVLASVGISTAPPITLLGKVAVVGLCGMVGVIARDRLLQRSANARIARLTAELPTVLQFLTLSLSAGEGILDAVRRVARISRGELATELSAVVAEVNAGMPFAASLTTLADATPHSGVVAVRGADHRRARAWYAPRRGTQRTVSGCTRRRQTSTHRAGGQEGGRDDGASRVPHPSDDHSFRDFPRNLRTAVRLLTATREEMTCRYFGD